jgi:hypothetical protein
LLIWFIGARDSLAIVFSSHPESISIQKNWAGSRSKAVKSLLALIAQDPATGLISYANTAIRHGRQNDAVLDFAGFWQEGRGEPPKMLIFDSRFTTYENLNKLGKSK